MSYRSLSPITGYTGHIPGEKWVVGSNTRRSRSWHRSKQRPAEGIGPGHLLIGGANGRMMGGGGRGLEEGQLAEEFGGMALAEEELGRGKWQEGAEGKEKPGQGEALCEVDGLAREEADRRPPPRPLPRKTSLQSEDAASVPPSAPSTSGKSRKSGRSRKTGDSLAEEVDIEGIGSTRTMTPEEGAESGRSSSSAREVARERRREGQEVGQAGNGTLEGGGQGPPPRRAMDAFEDIQPGWWSEGQALKNLRAHKMAMRGNSEPSAPAYDGLKMEAAGRPGAESVPTGRKSTPAGVFPAQWDADIPAPGYSGHLTELYQTSVGHSYGVAAKESRRRQHRYQDGLTSGGGTFLSSTNSSAGKGKATGAQQQNGDSEFEEQPQQKVSPY